VAESHLLGNRRLTRSSIAGPYVLRARLCGTPEALRFLRCFLATSERRTIKRYPLKLQMTVRGSGVSASGEVSTESKDVSSHGVYFFLDRPLKSGSPLEIMLILPEEITQGDPVRIRCEARVQRAESVVEGRIGIAAKIERYRFLPGKRERRKAS